MVHAHRLSATTIMVDGVAHAPGDSMAATEALLC
jgi:hypothetical protein